MSCERRRKVGRATVFRTIKLLLDLNILCRILLDDGTLHYRVSTRGHHHHLVCRECGRVEDFTQLRRAARSSGSSRGRPTTRSRATGSRCTAAVDACRHAHEGAAARCPADRADRIARLDASAAAMPRAARALPRPRRRDDRLRPPRHPQPRQRRHPAQPGREHHRAERQRQEHAAEGDRRPRPARRRRHSPLRPAGRPHAAPHRLRAAAGRRRLELPGVRARRRDDGALPAPRLAPPRDARRSPLRRRCARRARHHASLPTSRSASSPAASNGARSSPAPSRRSPT